MRILNISCSLGVILIASCGVIKHQDQSNTRSENSTVVDGQVVNIGFDFGENELGIVPFATRATLPTLDWHVECSESGGVNTNIITSQITWGALTTLTVRANCQNPDVKLDQFRFHWKNSVNAETDVTFTGSNQIVNLGLARVQLIETTANPGSKQTSRRYKIQEITNQVDGSAGATIGAQNVSVQFDTVANRMCSDVSISSPAGDPIVVAKFDAPEAPHANPSCPTACAITANSAGLPSELQGAAFAIDQATKTVTVDFRGINSANINGSTYSWTMTMSEVSPPAGETANVCTATISVTPSANGNADFN